MRNIILSPVIEFKHIIKDENNIEFTFNNESRNLSTKNKDDFQYILQQFLTDKKYPAGCETNYRTKYGIMPGHAFSLLETNTINIDGEKYDVVKLFNP